MAVLKHVHKIMERKLTGYGDLHPKLADRVLGGKLLRPWIVQSLVRQDKASSLTCCAALELMQLGFIIADDICDDSATRRGRPAWHMVVGKDNAWNDANTLVALSNETICEEMKDHPRQGSILHDVATTVRTSCLGQRDDMNVRLMNTDDFMGKYHAIVNAKTSAYTFKLPILMAFNINMWDRPPNKDIECVSNNLGQLYQSTNDMSKIFNPSSDDLCKRRLTWQAATSATIFPSPAVVKLDPDALMKAYKGYDLFNAHKLYCEQRYEDAVRAAHKIDSALPDRAVANFVRELNTRYSNV